AWLWAVQAGCVVLASCGGTSDPPLAALGGPNPGLSSSALASFLRGKAVFERRFTRSEGHGPDFNVSSCRSCHEFPTTGGSSPLYRNFFLVADIRNDEMVAVLDDDQFVARSFSYERTMRERIPLTADIIAQRNAPPMFGLGFFERISATAILANRDPSDMDGDGISGRENRDGAQVGRFGYKAQEGNLEDFVRGPLFNHLGITTDPLLAGAPQPLRVEAQISTPGTPTTDTDGTPDPELDIFELSDLLVYTQQLAPPPPLPMGSTARRGEEIFESLGCAKCHIPDMAGAPVDAYTDLLLHDMGAELADGVRLGNATGSEFRTQPLWGLRHHAPFLHDGSADTIDEAIRLHGGEADAIRNAYTQLSQDDRDAVLGFLETR
ncbi:MAG: di-heme oxidoredictase family protein, partial [Planctomycetota bacterium]